MYVATLISNPKTALLNAEIVETTRQSLGGDRVTWLHEAIACDIYLPTKPENFQTIWRKLQSLQIDSVVQPLRGRQKKILLADMDSTMIKQECIDELAIEAGIGDQVSAITARAMNGELDFKDSLLERVALLKDLPVSVIDDVLRNRITLMSGGPTLLATMKKNGAYCALVSGGFVDFTSAIAGKLGFDEDRGNILLRDGARLSGKPGLPILGSTAKVDAMREITQRLNLAPTDVIAVGDGANDVDMLQAAGTGVALHAKPAVAARASIQLNFTDLTGLLYLQGYKQSEFVFTR